MASDPGRRFFFALLTLLRFSINLGVLERPLILGLCWGLLTGDWQLGLGAALFFELLWLDHFPAGTFIPPNALFSTLLVLCLAEHFGFESPGALAFPLACAVPLAFLGSRMELFQRHLQDRSYNQLLNWARKGGRMEHGGNPERLILKSLVQTFLLNLWLFVCTFLIFVWIVNRFQALWPGLFAPRDLTWEHLWLLAAMGGILSLRRRKSYILLAVGLGVAAAVGFLTP